MAGRHTSGNVSAVEGAVFLGLQGVNFVLAAARVPLWNYTLGTALGIAPRTAATAFVAAGLEQLQAKDLTDTPRWMLLSGMIAFVLMCIVLGSLANRALRTMTAPGK